ncbi:MAG: ABC transporter ATP-binding protein [Erysipelotrichaceae bacterium]|nr:ABC transporter ATP-binding protein [Erysipelotrichaceae bacterium]
MNEIIESGDINAEHVSFSYGDQPVLNDVSFVIPENKTTAVIGYSGTGKSTILKLLERMYEPNEGRIMLHGENIEKTNIVNYRNLMAFLMQNSPLMSGSIRENILYGIKKKVSDEEIMDACERTNLKEFIETAGLDYMIEPFGENLSGGQRQKLALARAILSDKPYLLLDEPTSSIDIPSRTDICNTLKSLKGRKTIVVVTHDRQIVDQADHIVVVNKDHSVSSGTHSEMLLLSDFYKNFVNAKEAEYGKE